MTVNLTPAVRLIFSNNHLVCILCIPDNIRYDLGFFISWPRKIIFGLATVSHQGIVSIRDFFRLRRNLKHCCCVYRTYCYLLCYLVIFLTNIRPLTWRQTDMTCCDTSCIPDHSSCQGPKTGNKIITGAHTYCVCVCDDFALATVQTSCTHNCRDIKWGLFWRCTSHDDLLCPWYNEQWAYLQSERPMLDQRRALALCYKALSSHRPHCAVPQIWSTAPTRWTWTFLSWRTRCLSGPPTLAGWWSSSPSSPHNTSWSTAMRWAGWSIHSRWSWDFPHELYL